MKARLFSCLLAALVLSVTACQRQPATDKAAALPPATALPALRSEQLANLAYPSDFAQGGQARLRNGAYQEAPDPLTGVGLNVRLGPWQASGDLDGDGQPDSAVVLVSDPGGSGVFYELAVVSNQAGQPGAIRLIPLGDRVDIRGVSIAEGHIQVDLLQAGPRDPACCPTQRLSRQFRLQGDRLVAQGLPAQKAG